MLSLYLLWSCLVCVPSLASKRTWQPEPGGMESAKEKKSSSTQACVLSQNTTGNRVGSKAEWEDHLGAETGC